MKPIEFDGLFKRKSLNDETNSEIKEKSTQVNQYKILRVNDLLKLPQVMGI